MRDSLANTSLILPVTLLALAWTGCDFLWSLETPFSYVQLQGGTFDMGSPDDELCRQPSEVLHQVTLTRGFEISSIEVAQGQFKELMQYNPARNSSCGELCPVERVSWDEAAAYCNALSAKNGLDPCYTCTGKSAAVRCKEAQALEGQKVYLCSGYRLPTEAEWEYAYRAGSQTAYYHGPNFSCEGNDAGANRIAWYAPAAGSIQFPGLKWANDFELFDMAGNVWEWCHDWYQEDLGSEAVTNPAGPSSGDYRVLRGGSFKTTPATLRAAHRHTTSAVRGNDIGFRCVRSR